MAFGTRAEDGPAIALVSGEAGIGKTRLLRELIDALDMLYLCDRFKCLPSQVDAEDASLMRMILLERRYRGRE